MIMIRALLVAGTIAAPIAAPIATAITGSTSPAISANDQCGDGYE
jgi:hypothetical protein